MNGDMQHRHAALKARVAGALTTGVVVSLALAPEALAKMASNHNETVLALDGAAVHDKDRGVDDDRQQRHAALKARLAGALTTGVVVSLALAPEAVAKIASNHNETVLALG